MNALKLFDLSGKSALVTGGSKGLGRTIAFALAEAGSDVWVASRNAEQCAVVAEEIKAATGRAAFSEKLDVSDKKSVTDVVDSVNEKFGKLDILVNNSGATWGAPIEDMPLEKWEQVLRVNLTGTFLACQAVIPIMKENGWGRIINVSSIVGLVSPPDFMNTVGYTASKGGIISLTRELAIKMATNNIVVNAIAPSFFPTKMTSAFIEKFGDRMIDQSPMKRLGEDDDLKGVVVFLASEASRYVTGQVLAVDGGYTAA
ncbi:MAG: 3-oxoacyl-ACP reductase FabG [Thaumarchaeota archaeon]|nr:3-oxoacyl-ACP reductase FabG [Nitrososphaerota archaeon]